VSLKRLYKLRFSSTEMTKMMNMKYLKPCFLQVVSKTAKAKTHFIIVDAVSVTKSKKTSCPLECKPTIALKDLLGAITIGVAKEDFFL